MIKQQFDEKGKPLQMAFRVVLHDVRGPDGIVWLVAFVIDSSNKEVEVARMHPGLLRGSHEKEAMGDFGGTISKIITRIFEEETGTKVVRELVVDPDVMDPETLEPRKGH